MMKILKISFFFIFAFSILFLPACVPSNFTYFTEPTVKEKEKTATLAPTFTSDPNAYLTATPDITGQELLFEVADSMAVNNGVESDAVLTLKKDWLVTQIITYHWNGATGAMPGTIALRSQDGKLYGPWQALGSPGQNNVPNAYWNVYPGVVIPKGTYIIVDSDPSTWSSNLNTGGIGMVYVYGKNP